MKKAALLLFLMLSVFAAYRGAEAKDGFYTVINDINGDTHYMDGVIDSGELTEGILSYTVFKDGNPIIEVKPKCIGTVSLLKEKTPLNGYYSVKFALDKAECFLTGLSASNLDMVQKKLTDAVLENSEFELESVDFIDAEKTAIEGFGDDLQCWAASSADMLCYTGWADEAEEVSFSGEDDVFDLYSGSFEDSGGDQFFGGQWFFNGTYRPEREDWGYAKVNDYGGSGGYLKKYFWKDKLDYIGIDGHRENMQKVLESLEEGFGAGIVLRWINDDGQIEGGHALTLWGYIEKKTELKALIVSDSDSDRVYDENRRCAPNKLHVLNVSPYEKFGYETWSFDGYGGVISAVVTLEPYKDSATRETDKAASLDLFSDPEFFVENISFSNDKDIMGNSDKVWEDEEIFAAAEVFNYGEAEYRGLLDFEVSVMDSEEREVFSGSFSEEVLLGAYESAFLHFELPRLNVGDYRVRVILNPEKKIREAYYYNNGYEEKFAVASNAFDRQNISVNADIGEFSCGEAEAFFTYEGLTEAESFYHEPIYSLYVSYFENGEWGEYSQADTPCGSGELPDECILSAHGDKVRFKLCIEEKGLPSTVVESEECEICYAKLSIRAAAENSGEYTKLEAGAKELKNGEVIAFEVLNESNYDSGEETCSVCVYAANDDMILLYENENVRVGFGETSAVEKITSWDKELSGVYDILAVMYGNGGYGEAYLGSLWVKEKPSGVVTTSKDEVNPYDGEVSLREAVEYGERVSFNLAGGDNVIYVESPIIIDGNVKIEGSEINIYGNGESGIFLVTETGSLTASGISLSGGKSFANGGGIENRGGSVDLTGCVIESCIGGRMGGGIYSEGGTALLKNCILKGNEAGYGGAVGIEGGSKLEMLNCSVFENSSNCGALYNSGAEASAVYTTFFNNVSVSSGGGAVSSLGQTYMVGCIASLNGETDVSGNVKLYGTYFTAADSDVEADGLSECGKGERIFVCRGDKTVLYEQSGNEISMSPIIYEGVFVKDRDGALYCSRDGAEWTKTEADSAFDEADYGLDFAGEKHGALFGSRAKAEHKAFMTDENTIYVPEAVKALLIERAENENGETKAVKTRECLLETGTNAIERETERGKVMIWKSLESMEPIGNFALQ